MIQDNKLIAKNTVILYFRLIITSIISLISSRFVLNGLGHSDFGLYSVIGSVVVMMAFLNTVMVSTSYRYIAFEMGRDNDEGVNKVFNISLVIHISLALLVLITTETIGVNYVKVFLNIENKRVADAIFVLRLSAYLTVFNILSVPFQGLITANEKFSVRAVFEISRSIFNLCSAILIINFLGNKIRLYSLLMTISSIIVASFFFIYCYKRYNSIIKWKFQTDVAKYKEMLNFSGWIMLGAAASVGQKSFSALLINSFFGTLFNAAYGIANSVNNIVTSFTNTLSQAAIPQITKSYSAGNNNRSINLTAYISKYSMFLILLVSTPILLETEFLIELWLGNAPKDTVKMIQLVVVNSIISSLGSGLPALIQASGKIKWFQVILSFLSLLSIPIGYFLFLIGQPPHTIFFSFIVTSIINIVLWQVLLKKIINFDVKSFLKTSYLRVLYVILLIMPLFVFNTWFNKGRVDVIVVFILSILTVMASIFLVGLDKNEKIILIEKIKNQIS